MGGNRRWRVSQFDVAFSVAADDGLNAASDGCRRICAAHSTGMTTRRRISGEAFTNGDESWITRFYCRREYGSHIDTAGILAI